VSEHDEEDPYGGDWGDIGGWPEPALPPEEEEPGEPVAWPPDEDAGEDGQAGDGGSAGA
jgi:hypothetical protein